MYSYQLRDHSKFCLHNQDVPDNLFIHASQTDFDE